MIEYTLRQLEVFAAAAEQESLTRAAELLHLTQSTASTHLRTLEQCLGVPLLLRRGQGGVTLTEDGHRLYPMVKKILSQCQTLEAAARDPERQTALPLLLGASTVPGQYMLPELMAAFLQRHPTYRYELRHGDENWGEPVTLSRSILVNYYGTVLTREPFQLPVEGWIPLESGSLSFRDGSCRTLAEFREKYPASK